VRYLPEIFGTMAQVPVAQSAARRPNSMWLAFLALSKHVILSGDIEHLAADFFACDAFGITTKPLCFPTEALNAQ
jgi:hypothetical protein